MPTALLSVWDKTGLIDFAAALHRAGWQLIASGGTARALAEAGLPARQVADLTGEPEMLDGRVKTLHPAIHAGLLARDTEADHAALAARGWPLIDLLAVNLYPFEQVIARPEVSLDEAIENIDIGGVALLRAAAKNFARVTALCDPGDYAAALDPGDPLDFRRRMARKAFALTAAYDAAIEAYFAGLAGEDRTLRLRLHPVYDLRYGENPHQRAALCSLQPDGTPLGGQLLQGKALSYNNLLDLDAAWRSVARFAEPAAVVVKHVSPCGIAVASHPAQALAAAIACDPVSAFGSVVAANREVDEDFVAGLGDVFVECLIAPGYSIGALEHLAARKNLRVVQMPGVELAEQFEYRSVVGGWLRQTSDIGDPADAPEWRVVTERQPSPAELEVLRFAWQAVQPVRSNAIVFARSEAGVFFTAGIGGGQPNRVDCVRIAGERAGRKAGGSVMASDAFFPFPDGIEVAASFGITAVVQPGGSTRDRQVIDAANAAGMAMVFTGVRHFRH